MKHTAFFPWTFLIFNALLDFSLIAKCALYFMHNEYKDIFMLNYLLVLSLW